MSRNLGSRGTKRRYQKDRSPTRPCTRATLDPVPLVRQCNGTPPTSTRGTARIGPMPGNGEMALLKVTQRLQPLRDLLLLRRIEIAGVRVNAGRAERRRTDLHRPGRETRRVKHL